MSTVPAGVVVVEPPPYPAPDVPAAGGPAGSIGRGEHWLEVPDGPEPNPVLEPIQVFVDAERAVRTWCRAVDLGAGSGRIFFGVPANPNFPLIVLRRIGGGPLPGDTPIDSALISFDVWAERKNDAALVATRLVGAIRNLRAGTPMGLDPATGRTALGLGADVTMGPLWRPDGDAGRARYITDAAFTLRAA